MSSTVPAFPPLSDILGAASIGFSVSCVVFGVLTAQVFTYFRRYPADRRLYKYLVALSWILELIDQVFIGHAMYFYAITNFGNTFVLFQTKIIWTLILQITLGGIVGIIVKACFTMRVWRFSNRNFYVIIPLSLFTLAQFALVILYTVEAFKLPELMHVPSMRKTATASLVIGIVADSATAIALCFFLRRLRTGFQKSDSLIQALIVYAVSTGALTSAVGVCTLILYNGFPNSLYFMGAYFVHGKLYAISFLATLNSRQNNRKANSEPIKPNSSNLPSNVYVMNHPSSSMNLHPKARIEVQAVSTPYEPDNSELEHGTPTSASVMWKF